jgi:O-antigen ligase
LDTGPLNEKTGSLELRGLRIAYAAFLLTAIGRVGELVPGLGALPLAKVSIGVGVMLLIAKWKRLPKLLPVTTPLLRTVVALAAVVIVTAPFSVWRGMTLQFFILQLPVIAAAVVMCCKISCSWDVLRGFMRVLVVAAIALAGASILAFHGGRAGASSSYDPNDLGYVLVSILPLALAFALTARTQVERVINAAVCAVLLVSLLLTSSRGGLVGLVAMLAALGLMPIRRPQDWTSLLRPEDWKSLKRPQDWKSLKRLRGARSRIHIVLPVVGLMCACVPLWFYLPAETRERLSSVLELSSDYNMDATNRDSRSAIWKRGLTAAVRRPVGYGVNTYPMVDLRMGGKFRAPHNSYLEVLVELGFLGLLLFIRMYVLSWRALQRVRQSLLAVAASEQHDQVLVFARMLQVALVGNAVSGFFLSMSYNTLLWVMFAAVIACASLVAASSATAASVDQAARLVSQRAARRKARRAARRKARG